jgi:hypothetical protein
MLDLHPLIQYTHMRLYSVDIEPVHKESSSMTVNFRTHSILFTDSSLCGSSSLSATKMKSPKQQRQKWKTVYANWIRKWLCPHYTIKLKLKWVKVNNATQNWRVGTKGYTTIRLLYYVRTGNPHILLYATRLYILGEPYVRTHSYGLLFPHFN